MIDWTNIEISNYRTGGFMKHTKLILVLFAFWSGLASAFPMPKGPRPAYTPQPPMMAYDFEGIVALSNCSGSLIQFEGQADTTPAFVLTNGHCYEGGFLEPGEVISGQGSTRRFMVLNPNSSDAGRVQATMVVYATMTKTDVTLYRLRETYTEIYQRYHVRPFKLAATHPIDQQPLDIVSGYWRRGYSCNINGFVFKLQEGNWTDEDSIRYSQPGCEVIGGTSGSPIIARGTRTVIGINNTGNEDGLRCQENNPCEIDEKGNVSVQQGQNYGQQTFWIYSCLTPSFDLDLNKPGCALPK